MQKAIGFIRGVKYRSMWSQDCELQQEQIELTADVEGFHILDIYKDDQRFSFRKKSTNDNLFKAVKRCQRENAKFLFIDIGRYRRNPIFLEVIGIVKDQDKRRKNKILYPISASKEVLEAIERHARFEEVDTQNRKKRPSAKPSKPKFDPIREWQVTNKVGTKRLNNFKHLYDGVRPIYKIIEEHIELKPREIADILNKDYFLTATGKRWDRDNTRKTMDLISDFLFREYAQLRDELGPDTMRVKGL